MIYFCLGFSLATAIAIGIVGTYVDSFGMLQYLWKARRQYLFKRAKDDLKHYMLDVEEIL